MDNIIRDIRKLTTIGAGSEDDLITKVVIPFFSHIGYSANQFELKYPISCYRPNKKGRKPEADCVFFSGANHNVNTSLLVTEVKRPDQPPAEEQARFYSANLFVPFYITWENFNFEIFQMQNFQAPSLLGKYSLTNLTFVEYGELKMMLSPSALSSFCERNEIKRFNISGEWKKSEGLYVDKLQETLRLFKILDMSKPRDILQGYVPLDICELTGEIIPEESVDSEIREGVHPSVLEKRLQHTREILSINDLLNRLTALVIVGDPGAGKTMLLKHLCIQHCYSESSRFPVFIAVRELVATQHTISEAIDRQIARYSSMDAPEALRERVILDGRLLLCVDGFDELDIEDPLHARTALRNIAADLSDIIGKNNENAIVISARRESWPTCRPEIPSMFHEYLISPLSSSSIRAFVSKWFGSEEIDIYESLNDEFRLRGYPEFVSNPLLLALTCIVYDKRRQLPSRIAILYQRCIDILLEEWNLTRRISRREKVHGLTPEHKQDLLSEIALSFHSKRRSCFSREEVLEELKAHLPKVGISSSEAGNTFDEISAQHGLLRSWSIEGFYAFPHMIFQEFFVAKALRDRSNGFEELIRRIDDPFWHSTLLIFAGMGDSSDLIGALLRTRNNILHSPLFLAVECLATGAKLMEIDVRHEVISRLKKLTDSESAFLRDRAIDALSLIDDPEAIAILQGLMRDKSGKLLAHSLSAKYAIKINGEEITDELIDEFIKSDVTCDYLLAALHWLPQRKAVSLLERLVISQEYPTEKTLEYERSVSHRRRSAASHLAKIGVDDAVPILMRLLKTSYLNDFVKEGIVDSLASIRHESTFSLLREIVSSESLPDDCKIRAAGHLGSADQCAKKYLLALVSNKEVNHYDRRDAARELCNFKLNDNDIPPLEELMSDTNNEVFWGGPSLASEAISNIGSPNALSSLRRAIKIWENSDNNDKDLVISRIEERLSLVFQEIDLESVITKYINSQEKGIIVNLNVSKLMAQFYLNKPVEAYKLILNILRESDPKPGYLAIMAFGLPELIPKISVTKELADACQDCLNRGSSDYMLPIIDQLWRRRDLNPEVREVFYLS